MIENWNTKLAYKVYFFLFPAGCSVESVKRTITIFDASEAPRKHNDKSRLETRGRNLAERILKIWDSEILLTTLEMKTKTTWVSRLTI